MAATQVVLPPGSPTPGMNHIVKPPKLRHIPELDGLRGIAAMAVVFHHICFATVGWLPAWPSPIKLLYILSERGRVGVEVFFVLSGFLITSILLRDREKPAYYRNFYWKRALRILPLYFVCLIGVFLFVPHSGSYVLLSLLFISNFTHIFHVEAFGPFWSLAIEEHFYVLWPTLIRKHSIDSLIRWCAWIILIVNLLRCVAAIFGHYNYFFTFFACDTLALGALIACYLNRRPQDPPGKVIPVLWIVASAVVGIALNVLPEHIFSASTLVENAFLAAASRTGDMLFSGAAVAFAVTRSGARSTAFLRSRVLVFFGLISYAVYMLHLYILTAYDHFHPLHRSNPFEYFLRLFVVIVLTIIISVASQYLLERPAMSLRKYVLLSSSNRNTQA